MMNSLGIGENRASCGPARMHLLLNGKVAQNLPKEISSGSRNLDLRVRSSNVAWQGQREHRRDSGVYGPARVQASAQEEEGSEETGCLPCLVTVGLAGGCFWDLGSSLCARVAAGATSGGHAPGGAAGIS